MTSNKSRKLYPYQERDIAILFSKIEGSKQNYRLLYQLPTGGGKTVVFSAIAQRFVQQYSKKVVVLTHRIELCKQTSTALKVAGITNTIIDSTVKKVSRKDRCGCYVAMVETLKNRIDDGQIDVNNVGLVIIDEAHHNSFHKLLDKFKYARIVGVTATPLSSDVNLPLRKYYDEMILGEGIASLIEQQYLAKPTTWRYDVELNTLKTGIHGDFTVSTSDELYSSPSMLELLMHAYESHSKNKKTLIFNNGIFTSKKVCQVFEDKGYSIRHLDNQTPAAERAEILKWFKTTKGAILSSVSILTTGFDEPTIQSVILNRATNSLTLYHQMIGRGARRLANKKTFSIVDLGNNTDRFGEWNAALDWQNIFEHPEDFYERVNTLSAYESHQMPSDMRAKFPNSSNISFDIQLAHQTALENNEKPKTVVRDSIRQHALMCADNSETVPEALLLVDELQKEIDWRVKQYAKCLGNVTRNYTEWLKDDYVAKLKILTQKIMHKRAVMKIAV